MGLVQVSNGVYEIYNLTNRPRPSLVIKTVKRCYGSRVNDGNDRPDIGCSETEFGIYSFGIYS